MSDSGKEVIGEVMKQEYELLGIDARTKTHYHPAHQGKVERTHLVIADMLAKFITSGETDWDLHIPHCMMAMNSAVNTSAGHSPFFLVHGRLPVLPPDALLMSQPPPKWRTYSEFVQELLGNTHQAFSAAAAQMGKISGENRDRINEKARLRQIEAGQKVLLYTPRLEPEAKHKLASYWKPGFQVIQTFGNVTFLIEELANHQRQLVHIDRIKVQHGTLPPSGHPSPTPPGHLPGQQTTGSLSGSSSQDNDSRVDHVSMGTRDPDYQI